MRLTIVNVAYPFAAVGPDAVGGAEQVLTRLDLALTESRHTSIVIACAESEVSGELIEISKCSGQITDEQRASSYRAIRAALHDVLASRHIDAVHFHGVDFYHYLSVVDIPTLVTLHLPPTWYPPEIFEFKHRTIYLQPVSKSQARACPPANHLLPPIENGVPVHNFCNRHARRSFALCLGRICPEKGFHIALDAAHRSKTALLLGGELFRYESHTRYFDAEIAPRLDRERRFVGPVGFKRKRRLLTAAKCLLVPSLVPETSSLVAMEALACGTPVIAFANGALPDIIEHGKTGFVVANEREMAAAIRVAHLLDPATCREAARARFSAHRMASEYLALYERLACHQDASLLCEH